MNPRMTTPCQRPSRLRSRACRRRTRLSITMPPSPYRGAPCRRPGGSARGRCRCARPRTRGGLRGRAGSGRGRRARVARRGSALTGRRRRGEVRTVCKCRKSGDVLYSPKADRAGRLLPVGHVLPSHAVDTGQSPVAMAKARNCAEAQHQCKWSSRYAPRRSLKCLTKSAVSER